LALGVCACLLAATAHGDQSLRYQKRALRFEGVRDFPVAGHHFELRSALVDHAEPATAVGERLALRFYLEQPAEVHITVRELDLKTYYWLDKVTPAAPWRTGFGNVFEWPGGDVLERIPNLELSDLGAVVRLGRAEPSLDEHVAPAILYQRAPPERAGGYIFSFHLRNDSTVTSSVFRDGSDQPLERKRFSRQRGGTVLSVRWDASAAAAGRYSLVLEGMELATNKPVRQTVRFYHQPIVR
jgi:hypothetical protein